MIKPTPGRVVWYYPPENTPTAGFARNYDGAPLAAHVARVRSDSCINLMVIETKTYPDGTQATGGAPLPELSPAA